MVYDTVSHDEGYKKSLPSDLGVCDRCGSISAIQHCSFYFLEKGEGTYEGDLCFPCISKALLKYTLINIFFTFFTYRGLFGGPIYIIVNLIKYLKYILHYILHFARKSGSMGHILTALLKLFSP